MAAVSATQLAQWAAAAGFRGNDQGVAVAIALATGADPAGPTGAWGIGGGGDGQAQAQAAYARFQAGGWATFPAHQTGSFLLYMPQATAVIQQAPQAAAADQPGIIGRIEQLPGQLLDNAVTANVPVVSDVAGAIKFLENPNTWKRGVMLVAGIMLMGIAAVKFGFDNIVTGPVRLLDSAGDEVANRAQLVGLFTHPSLRTPGGQMSQVGQQQAAARAAAAGANAGARAGARAEARRRPPARTTTASHATPPPAPPKSPKVAQAHQVLREVNEEKKKK